MTTTQTKEEALAKFLDVEVSDISESRHDECLFESGREEYLVLTDDEADQRARDQILDSVWAFNHSFLCSHSEAINEIPEEDFQAMQGKLCEGFNKAVLAMIDDVDHFVNDAILSDGRGHFMSSYDGEENESGEFFIYRTN